MPRIGTKSRIVPRDSATINCPCTRASRPPLFSSPRINAHCGALTFSLEVAVSVVSIKKLTAEEWERGRNRCRIKNCCARTSARGLRVYFRAQKLWRIAPLWTVFDERGNGARLFLSFFWGVCLKLLASLTLWCPHVRESYDLEILLVCFSRIFKEIWKREYKEMERRGKIFKFLYVLSMQYLEWWSLKGKQREIIKENYASMKETNEVEFMLCFVVKRDTNYFSSFKHRSSCSLTLFYILNSSRNNCEDNARNCTHP